MLTEQNYIDAARLLDCEIPCIKAVTEVESKGAGFLPDGKLKILFEPHIFWRELKLIDINPVQSDICYPKWGMKAYGKNSEQWPKLLRAIEINVDAAYNSASYGLFQIMGFNHYNAGYKSAKEMVEDYQKGEYNQLISFCNYIMHNHLDGKLRTKKWAEFAESYNGKSYKENNYDGKLAAAYKKFS